MCFSLQASVTAGLLLSVIGTYCLTQVRSRMSIPFASIPLLFGIQQYIEGIVWATFMYNLPHGINILATYAFLCFALIIWPLYIPLSLWSIEAQKNLQRILLVVFFLGATLSTFFTATLIISGARSEIFENHIAYTSPALMHYNQIYILLYYCLCTLIPFFISSHAHMALLGTVITLSLLATIWLWCTALTSVWCFFAALISSYIAYIITKQNL